MRKNAAGRWFKRLTLPIVSFAILLGLFLEIGAGQVWRCVTESDWRVLLAAIVITATLPLFGALRWRTIILAMGCPIRFDRSLRDTL